MLLDFKIRDRVTLDLDDTFNLENPNSLLLKYFNGYYKYLTVKSIHHIEVIATALKFEEIEQDSFDARRFKIFILPLLNLKL